MVQKILRLSDDVINKIAAGEVVENPASIAKELIENSLDAGAFRIEISIEGGGTQLFRIEDDGCGMGQEDALLCLERHATSKIRTEADLAHLATMGFRGEALAAISSVSKFEMRTSDGVAATRIEGQGGAVTRVEPCARNRGTTIVVRDLFFNVPARKKFLKSASANTGALTRMVETIALAHPEVSFSLTIDGEKKLQVESEEQKKRIDHLLSPMPHEVFSSELRGWLDSPDGAKVHRRGQYLFINRRPIFSPLISRAVKAGYGTRIPENSYPSFVLFLQMDPHLVDFNVHPQKREVRFSDEGKIFRLFEQTVAMAFESSAPVFSQPISFTRPSFSLAEDSPFLPQPLPQRHQPLSFDFSFAERPLAVVEGYFFLQADELLLIDLRLAHARVLYESLKQKNEGAQALMWPIEVAVEEEGIVEELQEMGIECRMIGKRMLAVDALPALLEAVDFLDFLNAWREGKKLDAAVARYARGAKKKFTTEEAFLLWKQLSKCCDPLYDPLGRRIWDRIDAARLKKLLEGT